jgi:hypothetical protein
MTSNYWFHLDHLKEVVEKVTDIGWKMPAIVELSIFMFAAPPELADQCKSTNGMLCMVSAVAFAETEAEGKAALLPLEDEHLTKMCLKKSICQASNFAALEDASGAAWPEGHRNLCENTFSNGKPVDIYMALKDHFIKCPSSQTVIVFLLSTGGKKILNNSPEVAFSADGQYYGGTWSIWKHEKDDAANMAWHRQSLELMRKHIDGYYIGETDYVAERSHIKEAYTADKMRKLEEIRAKYDPHSVFQGFAGGLPPAKA